MWSHYADQHRGICIEFDGAGQLMAHAQKVTYAPERKQINAYRDDRDAMLEKALLTKSDHWSYEHEWRLIRYREGPGVERFDPQNITGIIIGAHASSGAKQMVQKWASLRSTPIKLYQAFISRQRYELDIVEIEA